LLTELAAAKRVVGVKQSRKAIQNGTAAKVFLAFDADPTITCPIGDACAAAGVPVDQESSMEQLGQACRITVGASVAVILK
jgi:large subunit ribosomal protein L7A